MRKSVLAAWAVAIASLPGFLSLPATAVPGGHLRGAPAAPTGGGGAVDLDILFIGAHPDDEAFNLSTLGQWVEDDGANVGVVTITRGEGGGNAVGPEEGPELGLIREVEERRAVGKAGIGGVYYLDKVDFYYNVSAPLTESVWGHDSTLARVIRVVRATRPEIVITMDPSPTPGNHGHHQYAARMATEAYYLSGARSVFASQVRREGLRPWRVLKLYRAGGAITGDTGPRCPRAFEAEEPTDLISGVWSGRPSERHGQTWAAVELEAQRLYRSQGWFVFPDVPSDSDLLPCDYYTLIDSRVPFTADSTRRRAVFEGALEPAAGGWPLGTRFYLSLGRFRVVPGQTFVVTALLRTPQGGPGRSGTRLVLPPGWTSTGGSSAARRGAGTMRSVVFEVTPPRDIPPGRVRIGAVARSGSLRATTTEVVEVTPPVRGALQPLPAVANFRRWTPRVEAPQLDNLIDARLSIGLGEARRIGVDLRNFSNDVRSGSVTLQPPEGFSVEPRSKGYAGLRPGDKRRVRFTVTNTDAGLPTANEGGTEGDYGFTIVTRSRARGGSEIARSTSPGSLNLVPVTTIPKAPTAPTLDGVAAPGEYTGETLDAGRLWEGEAAAPEDASATAKVSWSRRALYFYVDVDDDVLGTVLPQSDAKRHFLVDSVELTIDPRGGSANTSTTYKLGVFPTTSDNGPAGYRDADYHQGPIAETAPGTRIASTVSDPYTGYALEVKVPFADLPDPIDPRGMGLNVLVYDSDTQDKTGQTRLAWSPFEGVQGDPYRWGHARLEGLDARRPDPHPGPPVFPLRATKSIASPHSILQSARDGVPLGAAPPVSRRQRAFFASRPRLDGSVLRVELGALAKGSVGLFALAPPYNTVASRRLRLDSGTRETVRKINIPLTRRQRKALADGGRVLAGFKTTGGRVDALSRLIGRG